MNVAQRFSFKDMAFFAGRDSLSAFLNPEGAVPLPLVELPEALNPLHGKGVRIFAKMMALSPLINTKLFAAFNMLQKAKEAGELEGVHTIVENTSSNMGLALAVLAPHCDIKHIVAIVQRDTAPSKLEMLRLAGIEYLFSNNAPQGLNGIEWAKQLGQQPGWFCPRQYENEANVEANERWLGAQILEQTAGSITVFASGVGTGGTITGVSRALRKALTGVKIIGVIPQQDNVPGVRSLERLKQVSIDWHSAIDLEIMVDAHGSYRESLKLFRHGIYGGPSSGLALAGLLKFLLTINARGDIDSLRNAEGEAVAVFPCPDSPIPYLEKYTTHLDPQDLA